MGNFAPSLINYNSCFFTPCNKFISDDDKREFIDSLENSKIMKNPIPPYDSKIFEQKVKNIQFWWRSTLIKKKTTLTSHSRSFTQYSTCIKKKTIDKPGVEVEIDTILDNINFNVNETEKRLENFVINEKELIGYINENKEHLVKSCLKYKDESIYYGYFNKNWEREGYGILIMPGGSKYQGFFKEDKMKGAGRLIEANGSYFEGYFDENKANGFGKYVSKEGNYYIGDFMNHLRHGQGEEHFPDNSKYVGSYFKGMKHGKGKFIWNDSSYYEGDFCKDEIEGFGLFKWEDGKLYQGYIKKGQLHGKGIFITPDKKKYIGEYSENLKNGLEVFFWPNGRKCCSQWKNGKQHGYGVFCKNNLTIYGKWENGRKVQNLSEKENHPQIQILKNKIHLMLHNDFYSCDKFTCIANNCYESSSLTYKESSCTDGRGK